MLWFVSLSGPILFHFFSFPPHDLPACLSNSSGNSLVSGTGNTVSGNTAPENYHPRLHNQKEYTYITLPGKFQIEWQSTGTTAYTAATEHKNPNMAKFIAQSLSLLVLKV